MTLPYTIIHSLRRFKYWDCEPEDIDIEDIAHSLSKLCRFTGHIKGNGIYSVAEHSVILSKLVKPKNRLWALLHDASETYINDLAHLLKWSIGPEYPALEAQLIYKVAAKFDLKPRWCPSEVHRLDRQLSLAELKKLVDPSFSLRRGGASRIIFTPQCWLPARAKMEFLKHFRIYTEERND